jgi:hypothetical protein
VLPTRLSRALALGSIAVTALACSPDAGVTGPTPAPVAAAPGPQQLLGGLVGGVVGGVVDATTGLLQGVLGLAVCEPVSTAVAARTIGPGGGEVRVGPHRLYVPAGALASDVRITGTTIPGTLRGVDFQPHGLRFSKPVRLTFDYDRCSIPAEAGDTEIVYMDAADKAIDRQPSVDYRWQRQVVAWTDHFSGYAVAFGRR